MCVYSRLFFGTGCWSCWSAGPWHCGSLPGCGRYTRSSFALTAAAEGSGQLEWWASSLPPGCRSESRAGSEDNPERKRRILWWIVYNSFWAGPILKRCRLLFWALACKTNYNCSETWTRTSCSLSFQPTLLTSSAFVSLVSCVLCKRVRAE